MKLKIGDKVLWRGAWGQNTMEEATVTGIEITYGDKYGFPVDEVPWAEVCGRNVIVDLDNGHWSYGFQIKPIEIMAKGGEA